MRRIFLPMWLDPARVQRDGNRLPRVRVLPAMFPKWEPASGGRICIVRDDRGRESALVCAPPPSEPDVQISRIRLSSRQSPHRDWHAVAWAALIVNSPSFVKYVFGQRRWSRPTPRPFVLCHLRRMLRSRMRTQPSSLAKVVW